MSDEVVGTRVDVCDQVVEIRRVIAGDVAQGSFEVRLPDGDAALLWTGEIDWAVKVRDLLTDGPQVAGLPSILDHDLDADPPRLLLTAPPATASAFDDTTWRAADPGDAIRSLQQLALVIAAVHERTGWFHGMKRRELHLDLLNHGLFVVAMPRLRIDAKPSVEAAWRDMRLIGELAYENFMDEDYPGGHQMAAMLQDRSVIAETGMVFPGLPQLLAGCVSPYGDLAYMDPLDLWDGLEQVRKELHRPLSFRVGAASTVGNYIFRKNNQDSCGHVAVNTICGSRKDSLGFFCVADGIGGIQDGEKASGLAVASACDAFGRGWARYGLEGLASQPVEFAQAIAKVVGQQLVLAGEFEPENNRGGTTFSGLLIAGGRAGVCHVGDSRIVLIRNGKHIPITHDHTLANILIALGELTESEAEEHELSQRTISRFLSTATEVEIGRVDGFGPAVETIQDDKPGIEVRRGDLFILTSDGAHGEIDRQRTDELLAEFFETPQLLCDAIVDNALRRIGRDNSTIMCVLIE